MITKMLPGIVISLFTIATAWGQPAQPASQPQSSPAQQPTQAEQKPQPPQNVSQSDAKKKYETLLKKAKEGGGPIDFRELRLAFFETPEYSPFEGMINNKSLWGTLGQGKSDETVKVAEAVLEKNYVDVNAHMVAYIAHRQSGNEEKAKYHRMWADGLLNSIKSSGDGMSTDTAFDVISVSEEYALFRSMGVQPVKQSLVRANGHTFDAVIVRDQQSSREITYYFNVDKPFSAYGRK